MSQIDPNTFAEVDSAIERVQRLGPRADSADVAIISEFENLSGSRANAARAALDAHRRG